MLVASVGLETLFSQPFSSRWEARWKGAALGQLLDIGVVDPL